MSQENVRLAFEVMDALSQRDLPKLIAITDPEVEWHSFFAQLGQGGVYHGHDGTRQFQSDVNDVFEIARADLDRGIGAGDAVVLTGRFHYRGHGSGVEADLALGWVLKFRRGKLIYFRAFREPDRAFEAVGLSEQNADADS